MFKRSALFASVLTATAAISMLTAAQGAGLIGTSQDDEWWLVETVDDCHVALHKDNILPWWADDTNARVRWTGGCHDGFITGSGSLIIDFNNMRLELRSSARDGVLEGSGNEAIFSSEPTDYPNRSSYGGFTPPPGMNWHDFGDVRNPMPRFYRQGCGFFVGDNGAPSQPDRCAQGSGPAFVASVRDYFAQQAAAQRPDQTLAQHANEDDTSTTPGNDGGELTATQCDARLRQHEDLIARHDPTRDREGRQAGARLSFEHAMWVTGGRLDVLDQYCQGRQDLAQHRADIQNAYDTSLAGCRALASDGGNSCARIEPALRP